jgi:hypothetical protein
MNSRTVRALSGTGAVAMVALGLWLMAPARVSAQASAGGAPGLTETPIGGTGGGGLPSTSIAPTGAPSAKPTAAPHHGGTAPVVRHHRAVRTAKADTPMKFTVEPAKALLRLNENTPIYVEPNVKSRRIKEGQKGKFLVVTGSTRYFVRAKLKSGQTGYVLMKAVDLVTPTNKIFVLTRDAPVLSQPNHWGRKHAEVHRGHAVNVVGLALNYAKIRMRSGVEGYIPVTALE